MSQNCFSRTCARVLEPATVDVDLAAAGILGTCPRCCQPSAPARQPTYLYPQYSAACESLNVRRSSETSLLPWRGGAARCSRVSRRRSLPVSDQRPWRAVVSRCVAAFERLDGGPGEDGAVDVEPGAVAGAVPAALGLVEGQEAAEVGATQRDGVRDDPHGAQQSAPLQDHERASSRLAWATSCSASPLVSRPWTP